MYKLIPSIVITPAQALSLRSEWENSEFLNYPHIAQLFENLNNLKLDFYLVAGIGLFANFCEAHRDFGQTWQEFNASYPETGELLKALWKMISGVT